MSPRPPLLFAAALLAVTALRCIPAARSTVATDVAIVGRAAPGICQVMGGTASVCGPVAVVSDVAALVASLLASIPAKRADGGKGTGMGEVVVYRGCVITLPVGVSAAEVIGRLP